MIVQPVQSSLQLACSPVVVDINAKVTLDVLFSVGESRIRILLDFYVVPELSNQITLGLPFFLNRHFDSMSVDSSKLNTDITAVLIKTPTPKKTQLPSLISIPITYVGTQVNLNSFAKVENHEPKSDPHSDGSLAVREARVPIEEQASTERANFDKSFRHVF